MVPVLQSLKALKASFSDGGYDKNSRGDDCNLIDGFQSKEESEIDISDAKISELLKSNDLRVKYSNIVLVECTPTVQLLPLCI